MILRDTCVVLISDANYLDYTEFLCHEIIQSGCDELDIFVISGLDEIDEAKFEKTFSKFSTVKLLQVDTSELLNLGVVSEGHVSISTYLKLMIGQIVPNKYSKALYFDIDILIHRNLNSLINFPLNRPIAGTQFSNGESRLLFGDDNSTYFSAGVLIIDLAYWRVNLVTKDLLSILQSNPNCRYQDQDILNIYFRENWQPLPLSFNYMAEYALNGVNSHKEIDALIVHFPGTRKPWTTRGHTTYHQIWRKRFSEFNPGALEKSGFESASHKIVKKVQSHKVGRLLNKLVPRKMKDVYLRYQERNLN